MGLPAFSVKRPVTSIMIFIGVVLLGFISWTRIPQELFPPITYPQITVVTFYKDAAPEEIEILITKIVEEAVGTVNGVRRITSTSKEETSLVMAEFNWNVNMDLAALGVREKIDLIKERLPRGADEPVVMKFNPFELPVMVLNVTAAGKGPYSRPEELLQLTRKVIKNELEKVEGVASANLSGGVEREIQVNINASRLTARGIPILNIVDTLGKSNINYPAGTIKEEFFEQLIRTIGEFGLVSEIPELPVYVDRPGEGKPPPRRWKNVSEQAGDKGVKMGRLVLLEDIAEIKDTVKERTSISRYNGRENISISIQKKAGSNTVQVADNIKKALAMIKSELPKEVEIKTAYDQSLFVKSSISGVRDAALQGGVLAFLVLLFFLGRVRSALIVSATIPISIMFTFSLMYFSGITINMISLGGLALGIGMLVDNGIVVIENIVRRRQLGDASKEASISGAGEVAGAIFSSTLTTVVVFLPMIFVVGIAGQLFKELAFTVTFSLLASLYVSLSLIPPLSARGGGGARKAKAWAQGLLAKLESFYSGLLKFFLNNKLIGLVIVLVIFAFSMALFTVVSTEFLPRIDQGQFVIKITMPPGTKLETTNGIAERVEEALHSIDDVVDVTVAIGSTKAKTAGEALETMGPHQARIMVNIKPKSERAHSTQEVIQELKSILENERLEGAEIEYLAQESVFQSAFQGGAPLEISIKGPEIEELGTISDLIKARLKSVDGVYGIRDSIVPPSPETKVHIMKKKAALYNLSVSDIALTAQSALKGVVATKFKEEGREIDVRVRLQESDRNDLRKVRRLILRSPLEVDVPLSEAAYLTKGKGPTEIMREDQQRVVFVSANIFKRTLGDVVKDVNEMLRKMKISSKYTVEVGGENLQMKESFNSLKFALLLSLILVYMIMASQFESLWQPFIIMFTIPLSLIGVVWALALTATNLSVMVILGVIVLGGIVVNNGIVLIDYVNRLRREKRMPTYDALVEASRTRLRPILMTASTTILGLLPLALGIMEGTELQVPMAITVMGGLFVSTFLSLVVIPMLYLALDKVVLKFVKAPPEVAAAPPVIPPPKEKVPPKIALPKAEELPIPKGVEKKPPGEEDYVTGLKRSRPELSDRQIALLDYIRENVRITRKQYADIFKISVPTAARDLRELQKKGLIRGEGPFGPGRYYELT